MKALTSAQGGIRGWHVLLAMVGFFLTVFAVDGVMMYDAISTFGGDTPDAYRTGLAYNKRIADERAQDDLGWTEATSFDGTAGKLTVSLKDRTGRGIDDLAVRATVGRPATDRADHDLALAPAGGGIYVAAIPGLAEGTWTLTLTASRTEDGKPSLVYRSKARLWKQP